MRDLAMRKYVGPAMIAGFRLGASLGNLGLIYILSRLYSSELVGLVSLLIATGLGLSVLSRFGVDVAILKYCPPLIKDGKWSQVDAFLYFFIVRTMAIYVLVMALYLLVFSDLDGYAIEVLVVTLSITAMAFISSITKSALLPTLSTAFEFGYSLIFASIVVVSFVFSGADFDEDMVIRCISASILLYASICVILAVIRFPLLRSKVRIGCKGNAIKNKESVNFAFIALAGYSYSYGHIWLASTIFDLSVVAGLAVISRVVFSVNFSMVIANIIYNPKFSIHCRNNDKDELERDAVKSLKMMLAFSFIPFIVVILFPSYILSLFNIEDPDIATALVVMAISQLVNVVTGNAASILNLIGRERVVRNTSFLHAFFAVGASYYVGQHFGVVGFAIVFSLAISSQNLVLVYLLRTKESIDLYRGFFK